MKVAFTVYSVGQNEPSRPEIGELDIYYRSGIGRRDEFLKFVRDAMGHDSYSVVDGQLFEDDPDDRRPIELIFGKSNKYYGDFQIEIGEGSEMFIFVTFQDEDREDDWVVDFLASLK